MPFELPLDANNALTRCLQLHRPPTSARRKYFGAVPRADRRRVNDPTLGSVHGRSPLASGLQLQWSALDEPATAASVETCKRSLILLMHIPAKAKSSQLPEFSCRFGAWNRLT